MSGFRNREDELKDLIKNYTGLDKLGIPFSDKNSVDILKAFLLNEIKTLSSKTISGSIGLRIKFAYDIAMPLFEFDKALFAETFQSAVTEDKDADFDRIFRIICGFKNIEMIIIGCRVVISMVDNSTTSDSDKQCKYKIISAKLRELRSSTEYNGLADRIKIDLEDIIKDLNVS